MVTISGVEGLTEIGRGGFGTVYRGVQPDLGRTVAVKVLRASLDETGMARFQRECHALAMLSDEDHVVTVHDAGVTRDGHPYLVMAYLPGGSVGASLRHGPLSVDRSLRAARDVARGLTAAHAAGVLHRDVKAENVLISAQGHATLVDFGIATMAGVETTSRAVTTTLSHAAPEVIGGGMPDERSDIYSVGSLLHHLVSGAAPFRLADGQPLVALIAQVATRPPPDLRLVGVPDAVAVVVERALAKAPADRYPSAAELVVAIEAAAATLGCPLAPLPLPPTGAGAGGVMTPYGGPVTGTDAGHVGAELSSSTIAVAASRARRPPAPEVPPARPRGRQRLAAGAAVLASLALIAVLVTFGVGRSDAEAADAPPGLRSAGPDTTSPADTATSTSGPTPPTTVAPPTTPMPPTSPATAGGDVTGAGGAGSTGPASDGSNGYSSGGYSAGGSTYASGSSGGSSAATGGASTSTEGSPGGVATTAEGTNPSPPTTAPAPPAAPATVRAGSPIVVARRADGEPARVQLRVWWAPGGGPVPVAYEVRRTVLASGSVVQPGTVVARVAGTASFAEVVSDRLDPADSYVVWEVSATDDPTRSAWVAALVEVPDLRDLTAWDATQLLRAVGAPPAYRPLTVAGQHAAESTVWAQTPRPGAIVGAGDPVVIGVWSTTGCGGDCGQPAPGNPARA